MMDENQIRVDASVAPPAGPGIGSATPSAIDTELSAKGIDLKPSEVKIVDVTGANGEVGKIPLEWNFHVYYRDAQGNVWSGPFVAKRLNNRDVAQVGIQRARMCNGMSFDSLDDATKSLTAILSHVTVSIKQAPKWWQPEDMYDITVVSQVYSWLMKKELSFRGNGLEG